MTDFFITFILPIFVYVFCILQYILYKEREKENKKIQFK